MQEMKAGLYADLSNADYHGGAGVSKSILDLVHRSPAHAHYALTAERKDEPTAAQRIGTAAHCLILEPAEFVKNYCLALRRQDVPNALEDREEIAAMVESLNAQHIAQHPNAISEKEKLIEMIEELNKSRLPKIATSGSKAELIDRILNSQTDETHTAETLNALKAGELKDIIAAMNETRAGLLSTSGSFADLVDVLRKNGVEVESWPEICSEYEAETGVSYTFSTSASRADMAAWLRANGVDVVLWSEVLAEWLQNNSDRIVLSQEEWEQLHAMREAVFNHPAASKLLTAVSGTAELSFYAIDEETGELCRVRPDYLRADGIVIDLKTTDDASPEEFARSIQKWRYYVQDPFYSDVINKAIEQAGLSIAKVKHFVFIAVEKKPPHAVGVYVLDDESRELGRQQYRANLNTYAECKRTGIWPAYSDKVKTIGVPDWYLKTNLAK